MPPGKACTCVAERHAPLAQLIQQALSLIFMGMRLIEEKTLRLKGFNVALFHPRIFRTRSIQCSVLHGRNYNLYARTMNEGT